jgi:hypothetical protein
MFFNRRGMLMNANTALFVVSEVPAETRFLRSASYTSNLLYIFHPPPNDIQPHNKNKINKHPNQPKEGDKYIPLANINNATKNKTIHLRLINIPEKKSISAL